MSRDDSRLAAVLGELADLGRRISDRAAELAGLVSDGVDEVPPGLADRLADVTTSTADLAAAAASVTAATETATTTVTDARRVAAAPARPGDRPATVGQAARHKPVARRTQRTRRRAATPVAGDRHPGPRDGGRRLQPLMPALVSAAVNALVILGLAIIFVAAEAKPKRPVLTLGATEESVVDELTPVEFEATDEPQAAVEQATAPLAELDPVMADAVVADAVTPDTVDLAADSAVTPASFEASDVLAAVGGGGAPGGTGRGGGGRQGEASFFGRTGQGQTVCFICDNSTSYRDGGFHTVLDEVARAVDSLRPEQSFFVIFFSDAAYPMFHPDRVEGLQPASAENKRRLRSWLATVEMCVGGQGIHEAARLAGTLSADVVYFLSDGEHVPSTVERMVSADFGGAEVHTFGMQQGVIDRRTGQVDPERLLRQQASDRNLVAIATAHGGTFTPVTVGPQAAMLERLRPIPKNRTPGPVWGLKL